MCICSSLARRQPREQVSAEELRRAGPVSDFSNQQVHVSLCSSSSLRISLMLMFKFQVVHVFQSPALVHLVAASKNLSKEKAVRVKS